MVIPPFTAPPAAGEKVTWSEADCPADSVLGVATPFTLNPAPFTVICEIWMSVNPGLLSVTAWVLLPFTSTLPKLRLLLLSDSCACVLEVAPFRCTLVDPPPCCVIAESVPEYVPVVFPEYATWNVADCPGPSESGVFNPMVANSVDEINNCE